MEKFNFAEAELNDASAGEKSVTLENSTSLEEVKSVEFRRQQSYGSRLAEYITGLSAEDPVLGERMAEDKKIIRVKYGLPDRETFSSQS